MEKTYTFHVLGMHCKACVFMTEDVLKDMPAISKATTRLGSKTVEITGEFGDKTPEEIARELSLALKPHGYSLSVEKPEVVSNKKDFLFALPIALGFIVAFVLLQKAGIVNLVNSSDVSYGTAFIIGIIASLSTCMAVVGGVVLSMSASFAHEGDKWKPQALFHVGRLVSFFLFGGVIGALGANFTLSTSGMFILSLIVGIVMLILGINLLDVFPWAKKFQPSMPKFFSKHALEVTKINHTLTPFLIGIVTFFLPCGFTQSMQIYTLGTGSFLAGAFTMFAFALGTFPVLALISFSSFSIRESNKSGIFFKTAGLIVIAFAIFNLINSLVVVGIINPVFNF